MKYFNLARETTHFKDSLKNHEQLHSPAGKFLRHAIFGMNDGLVSTLALLAGFVGAFMTQNVIIIAGVVEMMAGAISMALGTYISTKSQIEFYMREVKKERDDLEKKPTIEKEHVKEIYYNKGFRGKELNLIVTRLTSNKKIWLDVLVQEELGLSQTKMENPFTAGVVMFFAFVFGAFIPLSSFIFVPMTHALPTAIISSLFVLFLAGAIKTHFTGRHWLKSGFEMFLVGALATGVAYYAGSAIATFANYLL